MLHNGGPADHDKLSCRLSQILLRLNQGECLRPHELAEEFGVSLRTIQRDLGHRFASLPLERSEDGYRLDPHHLGQLNYHDLERFADDRSGIGHLYPRLEPRFLHDLLSGRLDTTLHVQGPDGEDLRPRQREFAQLEQAIQQRCRISFHYTKDDATKLVQAAPYQLIHHNGIWYLAALDGNRLKAYSFTKISRLLVSEQTFERQPQFEQQLREEDSIWLNRQKTDVMLHDYQTCGQLFPPSQVARQPENRSGTRRRHDGSLIVSARVAHVNQILPIVRYWLPNARILSPAILQAELEQSLRDYLEQC
ncbi:MAG: helix-turn-helix transcriptional regulator [Leptothrix sp. (in: b-proteobacteria)]